MKHTQMKSLKIFVLVYLLTSLFSCTRDLVSSQPEASELTSDLDTKSWNEFESEEYNIVFKYPNDWAVIYVEDISIFIAENEEDIWTLSSVYSLRVINPYVKRGNQNLNIPQKTTEVAQALLETLTTTGAQIIDPVYSVDINGKDGAVFFVKVDQKYNYTIALRLTQEKVVDLSITGSKNDIEEMKAILNAIALTVQTLED